jgi:hydrogenase expression/formation protein HypE
MVAIVAGADAEQVLATMRRHPESRAARVVGEVVEDPARLVVLKTSVGGRRIVDMLQGEQLPRIC